MFYLLDLQSIISGDLSRGSDDARNLRLLLYHHRLYFVQPSSNFILLEGEFVSFYLLYRMFFFLTTSVCILELLMEPLEGSVVTKEQ